MASSDKFVIFLPMDKKIFIQDEKTVLELACEHKIDIGHSCGGNATCGTCLVRVSSPRPLPKRNAVEKEMADDRNFLPEERLACQLKAKNQMIIEIPPVFKDP